MRTTSILLSTISVAVAVLAAQQPWLDASLPFEERLMAFVGTLNETQKHAMLSGDTEASACIHDSDSLRTVPPRPLRLHRLICILLTC